MKQKTKEPRPRKPSEEDEDDEEDEEENETKEPRIYLRIGSIETAIRINDPKLPLKILSEALENKRIKNYLKSYEKNRFVNDLRKNISYIG